MTNRSPVLVRLRHGPFWNVSYVIGLPGGEALAIDPAWDVPAILAAAAAHGMRITRSVVTHGHHDHAHGLAELTTATGARAFVHELDLAMVPAGEAEPLRAGALTLPGLGVAFIHTPGHTPGSICVAVDGRLFTGDTITATGPGRHGPDPGAREQLAASVDSIRGLLPASTLVYPGHDLGPTPVVPLGDVPAQRP